MGEQDKNFNYKIAIAGLMALVIAVLIVFYYSNAKSSNKIEFLLGEKEILMTDLAAWKAEADRLSGLNEVNEIELRDTRLRLRQLLDSVGKLHFTIARLEKSERRLFALEKRFDSMKLRNNYLAYNNDVLEDKYQKTRLEIKELQRIYSGSIPANRKGNPLNLGISSDKVVAINNLEGDSFRLRGGRPIATDQASSIEKLRGCFTLIGDDEIKENIKKVFFLQFKGPDNTVITDAVESSIIIGENTFSKQIEVVYSGEEINICDAISVPETTLSPGSYTLSIYDGINQLSSIQFELK